MVYFNIIKSLPGAITAMLNTNIKDAALVHSLTAAKTSIVIVGSVKLLLAAITSRNQDGAAGIVAGER